MGARASRDDVVDEVPRPDELRVGAPHALHHRVHQACKEALWRIERLPPIPHLPQAQQSAHSAVQQPDQPALLRV